MPKHVFISYSRIDEPQVQKLAQQLQRHNISTWIDSNEIRPGDNWIRKINDAIENASIVLAFVSPNSLSSEWVQGELDYAIKHNKTIVPVVIRGEPADVIPNELQTTRFVDVRPQGKGKLEDLVTMLHDSQPTT